jgi:hypothetical protein
LFEHDPFGKPESTFPDHALPSVALQRRAAGVTDAIAMLLQAGCHLEFVREDIFAEAVRVVPTSSFLGGRMWQRVLSESRAGAEQQCGQKTKSVKHGIPHKLWSSGASGP